MSACSSSYFILDKTYGIASVWVCLSTTEHWASVKLRATPRQSCVLVDRAWNNGERTGGGVVLGAGKASESRSGDDESSVMHFEVSVALEKSLSVRESSAKVSTVDTHLLVVMDDEK